MISEQRGHIVTVSSVTGLLGTYACTDYSATKFACVGFHESLFSELRAHGHDFIGMTLGMVVNELIITEPDNKLFLFQFVLITSTLVRSFVVNQDVVISEN